MSKKSLSIKLILLMGVVAISGCDPFPTKKIYIRSETCAEIEIIKEDPLEFGNEKIISMNDCPTVYGFSESDAGGVADWVRRQQKKK